jgi:hypothetical protein
LRRAGSSRAGVLETRSVFGAANPRPKPGRRRLKEKETIMTRTILLCLILGALVPVSASAKGIAVNPGFWEMSMTMTMPMFPAPQTRSYEECVEETELDPEDFQMDEDSECAASEVTVNGDTIDWVLKCDETVGRWSFTSTGDSMHGDGSMTVDTGDGEMVFTMSWEGKRLGDCP